ncbi:hypothetical protein GLW04_02625 [Halobacillus litoralis]|uniref:Lipoprotein n=1 Tax=Halobacillus litoralis TaxID=45668 RepID=A0A845DMW9_9BACI|nr:MULTISPECIES: hypothetical protein [Halobacillus]MYL18766.1 hypothetical protein [Halobacillus litoralis]MYL31491.1 hypothetical protein [Halobacillus halophilus]MYL39204.1 hypothetical protein [Halobacillus litoralis]
MKGWSITAFLALLLLCSCSNQERYIYEGDSEHWHGELEVNVTEKETTKDFALLFNGDVEELEEAGYVEYEYEMNTSTGNGEITLKHTPENGTFTHHSGSNSTMFNSDQTIRVTVEWGENKEEFVLKK